MRKVVKDINLFAAISNFNVFLPRPGETWVVDKVFTRIRDKAGTETTPASITLDNGTDGQNVVASVAVPVTGAIGSTVQHTVLPNIRLTSAAPLRLKHTVKSVGSTTNKQDVIVTLLKLSEIA